MSSNPVDVSPFSRGEAIATCPPGTIVTGGGFRFISQSTIVLISSPGTNGWVVSVHNPTSSSIPVFAIAQCAALLP